MEEREKIRKSKRKKAFRTFNGKRYSLYNAGSKKKVDDYIRKYGIPKKARYRRIKVGNEHRLYMRFPK